MNLTATKLFRLFLPAFGALALNSCVFKNECGYSSRLYNDCREYYDLMGVYHKECEANDISNDCAPQDGAGEQECLNCN
ncbi:MAG: hypothetical protein ACTTIC_08425 [Helicobacteraceae bacterium]